VVQAWGVSLEREDAEFLNLTPDEPYLTLHLDVMRELMGQVFVIGSYVLIDPTELMEDDATLAEVIKYPSDRSGRYVKVRLFDHYYKRPGTVVFKGMPKAADKWVDCNWLLPKTVKIKHKWDESLQMTVTMLGYRDRRRFERIRRRRERDVGSDDSDNFWTDLDSTSSESEELRNWL
jgi:hypothetical protein